MNLLLVVTTYLIPGPIPFERHEIDKFPAGYQVAVADVNGDGKPDVIALSTDADRVDWYENPTWKRHPVARTPKNIDLASYDLDGDGRPEIALASGFYFNESDRGGQIQWLSRPRQPDQLWQVHPIATDPVTHRLRWGDLDGDGKPELVHAPIFGPGSRGLADLKPAHLWAFRPPKDLAGGRWETWKIDETLTVLHGLYVGDIDGDGRDEVLTGSFEGIYRFDFEGTGATGQWKKVRISTGAPPANAAPTASRGASEVMPGKLGPSQFLGAIEPWHGNQVVVYTRPEQAGPALGAGLPTPPPWQRHVLDSSLVEGHALLVADLDGDGLDEIVAGWRAAGGGLRLYHAADRSGQKFNVVELDKKMPVEGAAIADLNGDGKPDIVALAGRINKLVWYENRRK